MYITAIFAFEETFTFSPKSFKWSDMHTNTDMQK